MNLKPIIAGLFGLVVGLAGYYLLGRTPSIVQPTTPPNAALMFEQDVRANVSYAAKALMTPPTRRQFTQADWQSLRHWVGQANGYNFATYEVLTFPSHRSLILWLTTSTDDPSNDWEIQQIQEANKLTSIPSPSFVKATTP